MNKLRPENTEITIYSTVWCGPCKMAKNFLTEHGFSFKEIDIEKHNISRKGTTVPQIVINKIPIGGFTDLLQLFDN